MRRAVHGVPFVRGSGEMGWFAYGDCWACPRTQLLNEYADLNTSDFRAGDKRRRTAERQCAVQLRFANGPDTSGCDKRRDLLAGGSHVGDVSATDVSVRDVALPVSRLRFSGRRNDDSASRDIYRDLKSVLVRVT